MYPELESLRSGIERRGENRETGEESKDTKELKAAAAMERADFLSHEVKTNQQQMQNIVLHMQQVIAAIKKLRAELNLSGDEIVSSVEEDARRIEKLKIKIQTYRTELELMRADLVREQTLDLAKEYPKMSPGEIEGIVKQKIDELYAQLED